MIKIITQDVRGFKPAIKGMRNPFNSWDKSDSEINDYDEGQIGSADLVLMRKLCSAGTEHRKYLRMIQVWTNITAPLYWWKEFDTYKIGTTSNSTSTMHKIHSKEFTIDDFSCEHLLDDSVACDFTLYPPKQEMMNTIHTLNACRRLYLETNNKVYWWQMIQLLPSSYNQTRTINLNYEVLASIYSQRKGHKLDEWNEFRKWIETLPYSEIITMNFESTNL